MKFASLLAFVAFLFGPQLAQAQHRGHGLEMDPEKRLERMTEELDLSPEQVEALRKIEADFADESEAVREKMETARAEKKALHQAKKAKVDEVLTEEQRNKMEEMHKERKKRFKHEGHSRGSRGE